MVGIFKFGGEKIERSSLSKKVRTEADARRLREHMVAKGPVLHIGGLVVDNPMYHPYHQDVIAQDRIASQQTLSRKFLNTFRMRRHDNY